MNPFHRLARIMTMTLLVLCAMLFAVLFGALPAEAKSPPAERRIALVIGNARYALVPLDNPSHDARLIAGNLKRLGFDVAEHHDLGAREFRRVVRDFARRVQDAPGASVFYYAGHGVQIDGRNYLLPVDVSPREEDEVKDESVDLDDLFVSRVDRARGSARIVILDACRDNPFANKTGGKTRSLKAAGGLAEMSSRGTLVAFASGPGAVAEDGPTGSHSVYTKHLAAEMMREGVEVEQMFKNVRVNVLRDTKERQVPWVNTSLTVNFAFNPGTTGVDTNAVAQDKAERLEAEITALQRRLLDVHLASTTTTNTNSTTTTEASPPTAKDTTAGSSPPSRPQPELERDLERQLRDAEAARVAARAARSSAVEPTARPAAAALPLTARASAEATKKRCSALLQRLSIGDSMTEDDLQHLVAMCP